MAVVRPFKAVRPTKNLAEKVAALPYDVMTSDEARDMVKDNPYSFLHIDKAEIDLDKNVDIYSDEVYNKALENFNKMIDDKIYFQDEKPMFYIYTLTMNGKSQTGIVACTSIDEYIQNKIKKHELTRKDKEMDRIRHVNTLNANTGPIFLTYRSNDEINNIIENFKKDNEPVYDFVSEDNIGHKAWVIDNENIINDIEKLFKQVDSLYIADGHHRNASAVSVGLKRREENTQYDKNAEFNFYLSVLFPDNQLHIMDYNRVVKDLNNLSSDEFFKLIEDKFECKAYNGNGCFTPIKQHSFGLYIDGKWFELTAKDKIINENDPVLRLDVSILQNELLEPILGIKDPRTDKRIDFVGGIRGLEELEKRVDSGEMRAAFSMFPTSMEQLMDIADAGKIMPPKSTWFEPKLRSGLFIHLLK